MTVRAWRRAAAGAVTVAAGALAGQVVATGPEPEASRAVRAGAATIVVPRAWRVVDRRAQAGTVTLATGDPAPARIIVAFAPRAGASLVPSALDRAFSGPDGAPRASRLGGYRAWSYRGGEVTVLPTIRGVVGIACMPRRAGETGRCASAMRSVSVARAAMLEPTPDLALKLRAPQVLATLDSLRARTRNELRGARPDKQARLARDLARGHEAALGALRPVAGSRGAALTRALAEAGRAYDAFADAAAGSAPARRADGGAADAAAGSTSARLGATRADVADADAAVDDAVARLAAAGAPSVQRPAAVAPAPARGGVSALTLALVLALGLLAVALAPAVVGRSRKAAAEPEPDPCVLAPIRRRLMTPPPTCGRWYEPPTGYGGRDRAPATARADQGDVVDSVNVSVLP